MFAPRSALQSGSGWAGSLELVRPSAQGWCCDGVAVAASVDDVAVRRRRLLSRTRSERRSLTADVRRSQLTQAVASQKAADVLRPQSSSSAVRTQPSQRATSTRSWPDRSECSTAPRQSAYAISAWSRSRHEVGVRGAGVGNGVGQGESSASPRARRSALGWDRARASYVLVFESSRSHQLRCNTTGDHVGISTERRRCP